MQTEREIEKSLYRDDVHIIIIIKSTESNRKFGHQKSGR